MMKMVMLVIMVIKITVMTATHHSSRLHSGSTTSHPACLSLDLKSHLWIVDCGEGLMNKLMMAGISKIRC